MTILEQIRWIITTFEGSIFTEDPVDTGGATKYGITLNTLAYARGGQKTTKTDVKNLTEAEAIAIGVQVFAEESGIATIVDAGLRLACLDYAFHSGWVPAIAALQRALGVDADGILGPITRDAANACAAVNIASQICTAREIRMQQRIQKRPTQVKFALGWWSRVTTVRQQLFL